MMVNMPWKIQHPCPRQAAQQDKGDINQPRYRSGGKDDNSLLLCCCSIWYRNWISHDVSNLAHICISPKSFNGPQIKGHHMGLTGNKRSSWVAQHSAAWFAFDLTLLAQLWPRRNRAILRNIKLLFKISLSRYCVNTLW